MGPLSNIFSVRPDVGRDPRTAAHEAGITLESALLSKLIGKSMAKTGSGPEAQFAADVFSQVIADAVARQGGVGLAKSIEDSLMSVSGAEAAEGGKESGAKVAHLHAVPSVGKQASAAMAAGATDEALSSLLVEGNSRISSGFGIRRDPLHGRHRFHHGLDVAAPEGADIRAVRSGTVTFAGERKGYGNVVEIDHGDGMSTLYAHASIINAKVGDHVNEGQVIAEVGSTGRSTGPHLHFEVRQADRVVDPHEALKKRSHRAEYPVNGRSLRPQNVK
jgi:murein DD-endopeptidase MepM/ murein hydrolase activator NlpD